MCFSRNPLCAQHGCVSASHPIVSSIGVDIMKKGGNAIDAAIAMAAALTVVEPTSNGLGSDAFAIVAYDHQLYGLNGSGKSPALLTKENVLKKHGPIEQMPRYGWTPVTTPGAVKAWVDLHERFGVLAFEELLQPAIDLAQNGFVVGDEIAKNWQNAMKRYKSMDQDDFSEIIKTFTKNNEAPLKRTLFTLPNHAKTLQSIAQTKGKSFYEGEIADKIEASSIKHGGFIRKADLMNHQSVWVDPVAVSYRGYDVYELPPNGHGIVALMGLNILNQYPFEGKNEEDVHRCFEAMKLAFASGKHFISDPELMKVDVKSLLSEDYAKQMKASIGDEAQMPIVHYPYQGGTVYLCTADKDGNMVSFIQSNYNGFGSGIVVEDTGIALQNRGVDFSLNEEAVNFLQPNKRSYHTIIPGFLAQGKRLIGPFGVMGGYMQPQGHLQVIRNMIDMVMNPQQALDEPRWQWIEGKKFIVEKHFDKEMIEALRKRGHLVEVEENHSRFGRGQIILRLENGLYLAGCESRCDSNIALY